MMYRKIPAYIENLIEQGENQQLDFKFEISDSKKIAKSLVAFANTDGGILLIGVKDNGVIKGIRTDEEFYMLEAAANFYSKPKIIFELKRWDIAKKTILEIKVLESNNKPHFAIDNSKKLISYIRIKDKNIIATNVIINVWKKENVRKPIKINYSRKEEFLLDYLSKNNSISLNQFYKIAEISKNQAEIILIDFILLNIITYYYVYPQFLYKLKNSNK